MFAALITVSNAKRGKKDGDECAAELVTDGGSRDPLCQPRASASEIARFPLKQQSARQQSAHTRRITRAAAISLVLVVVVVLFLLFLFGRKNLEVSGRPRDLSNSPATARDDDDDRSGSRRRSRGHADLGNYQRRHGDKLRRALKRGDRVSRVVLEPTRHDVFPVRCVIIRLEAAIALAVGINGDSLSF